MLGGLAVDETISVDGLLHRTVGEQQVADKVQLMLISTADTSKVMRQSTKRGLFNALDIGSMWLQDANEAQH